MSRSLRERFPRADAFEIPAPSDRPSALLIHGFTGTPAEMRPIGDLLSKTFQFHVSCPLLPGHGTYPADMDTVCVSDWFDALEEKLKSLQGRKQPIHLIGLSMGALLSLELTRKHPGTFSTTVFIVPPIKLRSLFFRYATPLMKVPLFNRLMPIVKKSDLFPGHVTYDRYSPSATGELAKLMETVSRSAPVSCPPTMICYSLGDKMVHPDSFDLFTRKVISEDKYVLQLSESTHVVPIAEERKLFLSELERFFRKQLQVSP